MTTTTTTAPTRTEVEAVADALVSLLTARLVPAERAMEACRVAGIAAGDLNDARIRAALGRTRKPRPAWMWPTLSGPGDFLPASDRAFRGQNGSHHDGAGAVESGSIGRNSTSSGASGVRPTSSERMDAAAAPAPSSSAPTTSPVPTSVEPSPVPTSVERFCASCTLWQLDSAFPPSGRRCRECVNRTRRERYLSVERADQIERATLRYVVAVGDPLLTCAQCGDPLREGEDVVAVAVSLIHARHLEGAE